MAQRRTADPNLVHLRKMATPSRLGAYIGKDYMGTPYIPYPWILECERRVLEAIIDPEVRIIVINVPPQSGKTSTFGMLLTAWYLGMNPYRQVIFIGYSDEYAGTWGEKTRNLLKRYGEELFGVGVSNSQDSKGNWKMNNGFGGMLSTGILGGITGNPGDLIVVDDVLKTMEDAASPGTLAKHLAEFDGSITSRFQDAAYDLAGKLVKPGTTVLITATRFAEVDLSGALKERAAVEGYVGRPIEVISIPALAEPPDDLELSPKELEEWRDFLGRKHGEGLKGRFSQRFYELTRDGMAKFVWSAVYQQNPSARDGGMFPRDLWKWWKDDEKPTLAREVRVWDLATTEGGGDWTVGTKMGSGPDGDLYVTDRQRFRKGTGDVELAVVQTAQLDGSGVKIKIEQERGGAGKSTVERFQKLLRGFVVEAAVADGTKEQRATSYSAMQNQMRVHLPDAWPESVRKEWIDEHRKMMGDGRRPRHDDQIDTAAYCVLDLLGQEAVELWIPGMSGVEDLYTNEADVRALLQSGILVGQ